MAARNDCSLTPRPHWQRRTNVWREVTNPADGLKGLRGDQQSAPMSNILKPIDLTDHAIRRAVFAVFDGLAAEHRALTTARRSMDLPALSVSNSTPNRRNHDAG